MSIINVKRCIAMLLGLTFLPVCVTAIAEGLTLDEARDFLSNPEQVYSEETGEYQPGVDMYVLWEKAGIEPAPAYEGAERYLFDYKFDTDQRAIIHYPELMFFYEGEIKVLRVSTSAALDCQFLFFRQGKGVWQFFDHVDIYAQKYEVPDMDFLGRNLFYIDEFEMLGTGVSYRTRVFYVVESGRIEKCLNVPLRGWVDGWGMMFSREFSSEIDFADNILTVDYEMQVSGNTYFYEPADENTPERFSLFSVNRSLGFDWDGRSLNASEAVSGCTAEDLYLLFYWGEEMFYAEFKDDFDRLQKKGDIRKEWYEEFMKRIS